MSSPLFPPELLILVGINAFLALSLLASLFDGHFTVATPYIYQIAALSGFGQIWVNYAFLFFFVETRFWCSLLYLAVALINIVAVNLYFAYKRLLIAAGMFLGAFTVPTGFLSFLFVSAYVNGMGILMPWLPIVPLESLYIVLVACMVILGLSIGVYVKPSVLGKRFRIGWRGHTSSMLNRAVDPKDDQEMKKGKGGEKSER